MTENATNAGALTRQRIMPENHWQWSMPVPFSQAWKVGNLLFIGGQLSADENGNVVAPGDIETQTRNVFEHLTTILREAGGDWSDVVKLNTFYCSDHEGDDITEFWQKMTAVRMEYLADPGPAGTAVRVQGLMGPGFLIEVEAIAVIDD